MACTSHLSVLRFLYGPGCEESKLLTDMCAWPHRSQLDGMSITYRHGNMQLVDQMRTTKKRISSQLLSWRAFPLLKFLQKSAAQSLKKIAQTNKTSLWAFVWFNAPTLNNHQHFHQSAVSEKNVMTSRDNFINDFASLRGSCAYRLWDATEIN